MRTLRLVGLTDDGKRLILVAEGDPDGERFELPVDDRVRAAARGDARRLTQFEMDQGTELPPRVIQSRIRAGETPEQVAAASGTRVERIMRFAHPVLQERARVAEQAREARVRLSESSPNLPLERFMAERLRLVDAVIDAVAWDAYRTEDGTWQVTGDWRAGDTSGTVRWTFDLPSRTVSPADVATTDFAEGTRLVRVAPEVPVVGPVAPAPRGRPVSVVREGPPAEEPVPAAVSEAAGDLVPDVQPPACPAEDGRPLDALLDEVADHDTVVLGRTGEDPDSDDPRARIPAWEDIVFGVRRHR